MSEHGWVPRRAHSRWPSSQRTGLKLGWGNGRGLWLEVSQPQESFSFTLGLLCKRVGLNTSIVMHPWTSLHT